MGKTINYQLSNEGRSKKQEDYHILPTRWCHLPDGATYQMVPSTIYQMVPPTTYQLSTNN